MRRILAAALIAATASAALAARPSHHAAPRPAAAPPWVLTPDGAGPLRIGMGERAAARALGVARLKHDIEEKGCFEAQAGRQRGVGLMFENGRLTVVSVYAPSPVKTAKGIGVGATEAEVRAAYPGLKAAPQAYDARPALDMTWLAPGGARGFKFTTTPKRRVAGVQAGEARSLGYMEGCL